MSPFTREEVAQLREAYANHGDMEPCTLPEALEGFACRIELALVDPSRLWRDRAGRRGGNMREPAR